MEIVAIGPTPPCIRCTTLVKRAREASESCSGGDRAIEVSYIKIPSPEVERYGKIACGKEVEEVGKVLPDFDAMRGLLDRLDELEGDQDGNAVEIDRLLRELDVVLAPVRARAEELDYLMTPVLVIDQKVHSAGYVPSLEDIRQWIRAGLDK